MLTVMTVAALAAAAQTPVSAHNCTCRAGGQSYPQGQVLCLRGKLARCEMFLNNSSWKIIADSCPVSSLPPGLLVMRVASLEAPAAARCIAPFSPGGGP